MHTHGSKWDRYARRQGHGDGKAQQGEARDKVRNGGAQAAAAGEEAGEEGERLEEEGEEQEDPAEAPQVVEAGRGGAAAEAADELRGRVGGAAVPGEAEGGRGAGAAAVAVVRAADVEVGPLGDVAGAADAAGRGLQEVGPVEGRRVGDAGEDDEEEHDEGAGEQHEGHEAEAGVCGAS